MASWIVDPDAGLQDGLGFGRLVLGEIHGRQAEFRTGQRPAKKPCFWKTGLRYRGTGM